MAKVHKAHKSSKKYGFQRNKKTTVAWIVGIVAVIAAIVIGVVAYNNSRTGSIPVTAPAEASLNNIADNWQVLASHTDKVVNEYAYYYAEGVDENGATVLTYTTDLIDVAQIYIKPTTMLETVETRGDYSRASIFTVDLGQLFAGEVDMDTTVMTLQAGNDNVLVFVASYDAETLDDSLLHAVIAELEAIIAEGPVVTEETVEETETAEETVETEAAEETTEETAETTEETTEAAE